MDVLMPQLGETVTEGKISKWFVKAGDAVRPGDNLFEIETDKVAMDVPAIAAGTLATIQVQAGETAPVGAVVAIILGEGETSVALPSHAPSTPAKIVSPELGRPDPRFREHERSLDHTAVTKLSPLMQPFLEVRTPERNYGSAQLPDGTRVTPLARRLARERGIDLSTIKGSGPRGRIVARDIAHARDTTIPPPGRGTNAHHLKELYRDSAYEELPLDNMRTTIAMRLTAAVQTIPHFYLSTDIEVGRLIALREEANAAASGQRDHAPGFRLTLNDFIIKAWATALQHVPAANAIWAENCIMRFTHSDISVAVAVDGGLITPVIAKAETKTLTTISDEMRDLAQRARSRRLKPSECQGGVSAISNLGKHGINSFSAIINPPHSTILAVGAARRSPTEAADGSVKFESVMTVTLSCDHRVIDGALGAELLSTFKRLVQQPISTMI